MDEQEEIDWEDPGVRAALCLLGSSLLEGTGRQDGQPTVSQVETMQAYLRAKALHLIHESGYKDLKSDG